MNCAAKGCTNQATQGVALMIPFKKRWLKVSPAPTKLLLGLELCADCLAKTSPKDFIGANNGMIEKIVFLQARRHGQPDFSAAYIVGVDFTDPDWIILKKPRT